MKKTHSLLPLFAAAMLAAGCTKEATVPGLRIFEEGMNGNGSKVLVDPSSPTANTWTSYDELGFYPGNGNEYFVQEGASGMFYANYNPTEDFIAWYPFSYHNGTDNAGSITLQELDNTIYCSNDGKLRVTFPMVAFGTAGCTSLTFQHVTGAIAFTLVNNRAAALPIEAVYLEASRSGSPLGLWPHPDPYTPNGIVCSKDAGGRLSISNTGVDYGFAYNTRDAEYDGGANDRLVVPAGGSVRLVLPVPITANTDFLVQLQTATLHPADEYEWEPYWDVSDDESDFITKHISNLTIERNHILNLPNLVIN